MENYVRNYMTASCRTANRPATPYFLTEDYHQRYSVPELREGYMARGILIEFASIEEIAQKAQSFQASADSQGLGEIDWSRLEVVRHTVTHVEISGVQDIASIVGEFRR